MKGVFAFLALNVTVLAFDAEVAACTAAQDDLAAIINEIEKAAMREHCEIACADVDGQACDADSMEKLAKQKACIAAIEDLAAVKPRFGSAEKFAKQIVCAKACADVEGVTCGFLVNGVSFVLFAILATTKYNTINI